MRRLADQALDRLNPTFCQLYPESGRPSSLPEQLLLATPEVKPLQSLEPAPGTHPFCFSPVVAQRLQRLFCCQVGFKGDRVKPQVAVNKKPPWRTAQNSAGD